ncbi:MAG: Alpha/Beta hydrolase protein [Podila humilis]|nr:MAG: Alpha/Beta hydrolase protein [Podila humilis]
MSEGFSISQLRGAIAWGAPYLDYDGGHPTVDVASKQDWIVVKGSGWKGCWVPFKASSTTNDLRPIGQGCDIVILFAHGGGFICGHPLQTIDVLRDLVKAVHDQSGLKVGILSIDYSFSPETPFPGALNECIAAYKALVQEYGVDAQRIITFGDSAGGNLAHVIP